MEVDYINRLFKTAVVEGHVKEAQAAGTDFIREKMKEVSFQRKVMRPRLIAKEECYVHKDSDTFYKIVAKDIKDANAYPISFIGKSKDTYVTEPRYEVIFYKIESEEWVKSIDELDVYAALGVPITDLIQENLIVSIQTAEDTKFKAACDTIISDYAAQSVNASGATFEKADFINLFKLLVQNQLKVGSLVMAEASMLDVWSWDTTDLGDNLAGEIILDGYKYNRLLKYPLITTIKNDIIPDGTTDAEVWAFAPVKNAESDVVAEGEEQTIETGGNYLGVSYVMKEEQMFIETIRGKIHMWASEILAEGIGNTKGVVKLYKD